MDVSEAIKKRHSARAFSGKRVELEKIDRILEAGSYAPSAVNSQPWRFYIAEGEKARERVMRAMADFNAWAMHAPVLIVVMADLRNAYRKEKKNYKIDIGLCLENMVLQAEELCLGSCPCAGFDAAILARELALPEYLEPVIVLPIGYELQGKELAELDEKYGNLKRELHKKGGKEALEGLIFRRN